MEYKGIITSITQYHEADGIINLLTSEGFITFAAHGIFKIDSKLSAICQLYNYVSVELSQSRKSGYFTLKGGQILLCLKNVYEDIESMLTLSFIVELANKTLDEDNKSNLFNNTLLAIKMVAERGNLLTIRLTYLANIIKLTGLTIEVNECVRCGSKKGIISVSFNDGGLICQNCLNVEDDKKTPLYIKLTRYIFIKDLEETIKKDLPKNESGWLIKELYNFLSKQLDIKLKSFELLEKIIH